MIKKSAAISISLLLCVAISGCDGLRPWSYQTAEDPVGQAGIDFAENSEALLALAENRIEDFAAQVLASQSSEEATLAAQAWFADAQLLAEQFAAEKTLTEKHARLWRRFERYRSHLSGNNGGPLFGPELNSQALTIVESLLRRARRIAEESLGEEAADAMEAIVIKEAANRPMSQLFDTASGALSGAFGMVGAGAGALRDGILNPVKSVGSAGKSAAGLLTPSLGIGDMVRVLDEYPQEWRTEAEILLDHDAITTTVNSLDRVSHATETVSESIDRLPEEVRRTLEQLAEEQADYQATLRELEKTLRAYEGGMGATEKLASQTDELVKSVDQTLKTANETVLAVQNLIMALPEPTPPDPNAPPSQPFNITEYTAALKELTGTLKQAQELVSTTGEVALSPQIVERLNSVNQQMAETINQTLDRTEAVVEASRVQGESLIDHIFLRLSQFVAIIAGLILLLMIAKRLLGRPKES